MDMRIPPLNNNIVLASNPPKSRILATEIGRTQEPRGLQLDALFHQGHHLRLLQRRHLRAHAIVILIVIVLSNSKSNNSNNHNNSTLRGAQVRAHDHRA